MPITIRFFSWEWINRFPFISYGKNSFGISPRIWNGLRTYTEVPLYVARSTDHEAPHYEILSTLLLLSPSSSKYFCQLLLLSHPPRSLLLNVKAKPGTELGYTYTPVIRNLQYHTEDASGSPH
jgi:hypothetical protein